MQVNNVKVMREALEKADVALSLISQSAWFIDANFEDTKAVIEAGSAIKDALSTPPRNCDLYNNKIEAACEWSNQKYRYLKTMQYFDDWLFSEAKGDNDEQ